MIASTRRFRLRRLAGAALVLGLACATGPKTYSTEDAEAPWGRYRSFSFAQPLGTDRADGPRTLLSQHLMQATRAELESRGYRFGGESPDLIVDFFLDTEEKIRATSTPSPGIGAYYGHRAGGYGVWGGYDTTISQYTEGTLHIDLVDAERNQIVWEGIAVGRIRKDAMERLAERVPVVVSEIFKRFPHTAGG